MDKSSVSGAPTQQIGKGKGTFRRSQAQLPGVPLTELSTNTGLDTRESRREHYGMNTITHDTFSAILADRVHELERANARLRGRIATLERTRDRQRALLRGLYYQLALHRQRVRDARASRDMWRHRCMVKEHS